MQQFGSAFQQHLNSGSGYLESGLNAAEAAGADMQKFGSTFSSALPPPAPPPAQDPSMGAGVNDPTQASYAGAAARQSQFGLGLSSGDAMAFCGPTAALAFAQTYGRNPTVDEAKAIAQQVGWNPNQGMAGVGSEVNLLQKMGVDAHATQGVDWGSVAQSATSGNPVILDTPGHYYYVDGFNANTGEFHVGTSGTDLKGGSEWMTPQQINQMPQSDGSVRSAVYADHPLGDGNPVTNLLGQAGQGLGQALGLTGPQPQQPGDLIDRARQAAAAAGIDPEIFTRQIQQESGFNPTAKSGAGALGIAQFMPDTAAGMGIDPLDPAAALYAAAQLDANNLQKYGGDWQKALAAYNAGGGNVDKYGGVPPFAETQSYVNNILGGAQNAIQQLGQGAQQLGQGAWNGVQQTAQDLFQGAQSQLDPLSQQLLNQTTTIGQGAQDLLSQGGNALAQLDPLSQQLLGLNQPEITPEAALAAGQQLNYGVSPLDLIPGNGGLGVPGVGTSTTGDTLERTIADWIAQNNPARDVPVLGGASTYAAQLATNPTNLALMASGLEPGAALGDLLSDPSLANLLRYRQPAETDINFALGGLPSLFDAGATLPEHAGNAARSVYEAAVQANTLPGSGSELLTRAMDQLAEYPEEVSGPVLRYAAETDAAPSTVASRILQWVQANPLESMPNPITGSSAAAREAGQQAVLDIADAVNTGRGNITQFPAGSIPDLLAQRSSASTALQELLDNLTGTQTAQRIPGAAGYLPPGTMPGQMDLGLGTPEALTQRLPQTGMTTAADWLQQQIDRGAQQGLPINQGASSLVDELAAGARNQLYPPEQTLGTFQQRVQPGTTPIQDIIDELVGNQTGKTPQYPPEQTLGTFQQRLQPGTTNINDLIDELTSSRSGAGIALPEGMTPQGAQALHSYIDTLPTNLGATPHTDLNNLLAAGANPAELTRFLDQLEGKGSPLALTWENLPQIVRMLRTGSMAGSLSTEAKVLASPFIQTAMRAPAGALNLILKGRAADIPDGLVGGWAGLGEGAKEAAQTLKYGTNYRNVIARAEGTGYSPGFDVTGTTRFQRALGTALMGMVRTHGAVGDIQAGIGRGANAALGATPEAAVEAGKQWALRSRQYGFTGQKIAQGIAMMRQADPRLDILGQIMMPFYGMAYSTMSGGIERSPLGFAGRVTDAMQGKPFDTAKLSNNLFGVGLFALAFAQAAAGNLTGDHPEGGAPKESIQLPGVGWVPTRMTGLADESLQQAASIYEAARDNQGDVGAMAKQAAASYMNHLTNASWVGDMANLFGTVGDIRDIATGNAGQEAQGWKDLAYQGTQIGKSFIPQEKLGEQLLGLGSPRSSDTVGPARRTGSGVARPPRPKTR